MRETRKEKGSKGRKEGRKERIRLKLQKRNVHYIIT